MTACKTLECGTKGQYRIWGLWHRDFTELKTDLTPYAKTCVRYQGYMLQPGILAMVCICNTTSWQYMEWNPAMKTTLRNIQVDK